jgi:hypothetical protein
MRGPTQLLKKVLVNFFDVSKALNLSVPKYAIADRFDETKNEYVGLKLVGLVDVDLNSDMLLVRAEVAQAQIARNTIKDKLAGGDTTGQDKRTQAKDRVIEQPPPPSPPSRPRRFYATVTLDPNRPTPQVNNIAQSILSELDRVRGTKITLTLDIDAETPGGFPEDVESAVRDNARDLRITDFGFEGERGLPHADRAMFYTISRGERRCLRGALLSVVGLGPQARSAGGE